MKKQELVDELSARTGQLKMTIGDLLDAMAACAKDRLTALEDFDIPGVVRLRVVPTAERNGRNPRTGETIRIPARKVVKAKVNAAIRTV